MKQGDEQDNASAEFTSQIRQTLDDSENNIDELTLSRIRAARANAVSVVDKKHSPGYGWIPASSFATVLVAVLATFLFSQNNDDITSVLQTSDMEMLSSVESLDMLEDLEFYQWLDIELDEEMESSVGTHAKTLG